MDAKYTPMSVVEFLVDSELKLTYGEVEHLSKLGTSLT